MLKNLLAINFLVTFSIWKKEKRIYNDKAFDKAPGNTGA